jgi:uncharacterized protein DUF4189
MRVRVAILAGAMMLAGAAPAAADMWGAVAYGPGGAWAYAYDFPTRGAAQRAALGRCNGRCQQVLTFVNSCGAYVVGQGAYGWGNDDTREGAITRAMAECRVRTGGCQLRVWACTTR